MRAQYDISLEQDAGGRPVIAIVDRDDGKTVTNDAEHVVAGVAASGFDLNGYRSC